ncbi:metalloprotease [Alteromonas aestuariivivens]|uniref:Metalloprotease n=1 Tax=Alteromonas aestuariivivens TaxID=1938339 RepID=A0A3D8M8F6_9ALTE|nr:neutral zinc metallopeptidase [Alteromonas aestuariivivens]RDV25953.1 metalloprotease [Alteromonas aestuariivivens]
MRWRQGRRSSNVEDRRGDPGMSGGSGMHLGSIVGLLPLLLKSKIGWLIIAGFIAFQFLGGGYSLQPSIPQSSLENQPGQSPAQSSRPDDEIADFVSVVLGSTEDVWGALFRQQGSQYRPPTLVLYSNMIQSACGFNSSAVGPFYCPGDQKVYLDLSFLSELKRLGAPGDFAFAYVIAHEVGHHVQRVTGIEGQVQAQRQRADQVTANRLSVRLELQADCYAGVWAHYAHTEQGMLESGDLEEGIGAASAVGDDRLMKKAGRSVSPDSFTHGSAAQRVQWFRQGFESGDVQQCNTF